MCQMMIDQEGHQPLVAVGHLRRGDELARAGASRPGAGKSRTSPVATITSPPKHEPPVLELLPVVEAVEAGLAASARPR